MIYGLSITLYINKDTTTSFFMLVHGCSYNTTPQFSLSNEPIYLDVNEQLDLTVINNDTATHTFTIDGYITTGNAIGSGATQSFSTSFPNAGTYRYYSAESYGHKVGASGVILVGYSLYPRFTWNLFEIDPGLSSGLANDSIQNVPLDYQPDLFYINGNYFPNTVNDTNAYVSVNLGDTAIIGIVNSGNMEHVLHFHGFHVEILEAKVSSGMVGWIKDTFPVKLDEALTVRLIANQNGVYPVHDHNLIAVTNAGLYPGGMITQISVSP